eukprot:CAMPEP_0119414448 /NCGR_PEP_ID=MMETSP1335-20130426/6986_1 /TAXON_ID=259385 /ORGANISM="Chrysoculter rhomboideus, Strain RCC1486" /LENGTH=132 /DNA_ID=CAMNT_0007439329 /DNA_START=19 /DNA_END=417 /DNA_ORIENTATION=+
MAASRALWAVFLAATIVLAAGDDSGANVDCAGMKTKALRQFLKRKGQSCVGCAEKEDYVKLCEEYKDAPDVAQPEPSPEPTRDGDKEKSIDDILASLKGMPGMENIKVFRPGDLDSLKEQFGDMGGDVKDEM